MASGRTCFINGNERLDTLIELLLNQLAPAGSDHV